MEGVETNLQEQLAAQQQAPQQLQSVFPNTASKRESALQAQLADSSDFSNRNAAEAELRVEPEPHPDNADRSSSLEHLGCWRTLTPKQHRGWTGHSSLRTWPQQ